MQRTQRRTRHKGNQHRPWYLSRAKPGLCAPQYFSLLLVRLSQHGPRHLISTFQPVLSTSYYALFVPAPNGRHHHFCIQTHHKTLSNAYECYRTKLPSKAKKLLVFRARFESPSELQCAESSIPDCRKDTVARVLIILAATFLQSAIV